MNLTRIVEGERLSGIECSLALRIDLMAAGAICAGIVVRFWLAFGYYLDADEAFHSRLATPGSFGCWRARCFHGFCIAGSE